MSRALTKNEFWVVTSSYTCYIHYWFSLEYAFRSTSMYPEMYRDSVLLLSQMCYPRLMCNPPVKKNKFSGCYYLLDEGTFIFLNYRRCLAALSNNILHIISDLGDAEDRAVVEKEIYRRQLRGGASCENQW